MTAEDFRKLKHELRTPVNHILGYGELIQETAADAGDETIAALAGRIQRNGLLLARLMEEGLLPEAYNMDEARLGQLRRNLHPVIERILQAAVPDPEPPGIGPYADDLQKVCRAANQLAALLVSNLPACE